MKMKHEGFTPGPWTFFDNSEDEYGEARFSIVHNGPIAYLGENGYGRENAEANARLIAAAPALLARVEKLEALLGRAIALLDTIDPVKKSHSRDAFRAEIRAALADKL